MSESPIEQVKSAPTILIVEDHPASREILKIQIETLGYRVLEADSGEKAVQIAFGAPPDLIIMDHSLPGMTGTETTVRLKEDPRTSRIPVVAHTAWNDESYEEKAKSAGIVALLSKPIHPRLLREIIEELLPQSF